MHPLYTKIIAGVIAVTLALTAATLPTQAASSTNLREAQAALNKMGINAGPVDGQFGPKTARALCTFRWLTGDLMTRKNLDARLAKKITAYSKAYPTYQHFPKTIKHKGQKTYVLVSKTCQSMVYVENQQFVGVLYVSTGKKGYETPGGTYRLGGTHKGWSCSTQWPDFKDGTCRKQSSGKFATSDATGNMYNKRPIVRGVMLHGSTSVPTSPASHGCIRVSIAQSDWLYKHVGNRDTGGAPLITIVGSYY